MVVNEDLTLIAQRIIPFILNATASDVVVGIRFIFKDSCLNIDGALTWQLNYNLMKLDRPPNVFMKPRFCCFNPLALPYNNTVEFSDEILISASSPHIF